MYKSCARFSELKWRAKVFDGEITFARFCIYMGTIKSILYTFRRICYDRLLRYTNPRVVFSSELSEIPCLLYLTPRELFSASTREVIFLRILAAKLYCNTILSD